MGKEASMDGVVAGADDDLARLLFVQVDICLLSAGDDIKAEVIEGAFLEVDAAGAISNIRRDNGAGVDIDEVNTMLCRRGGDDMDVIVFDKEP